MTTIQPNPKLQRVKTTRADIQRLIDKNDAEIKSLQRQIMLLHNHGNDLEDRLNRISDNIYTYRQKKVKAKEGRTLVEKLIGRVYWNEEFKDEDSGESIWIKRSRICRVDGKPTDQLGNQLEYYEVKK